MLQVSDGDEPRAKETTMTTFPGFKRTAMGDYMGSSSYFGSCCGCGVQFMSTHEIVLVPTDAVRSLNGFRHNPACERCARRATLPTHFVVMARLGGSASAHVSPVKENGEVLTFETEEAAKEKAATLCASASRFSANQTHYYAEARA